MKSMLKGLDKFSLPEVEEKVLKFWRTNRIFEKSLEKNRGQRKFVFFEGPPYANGRPGIHHVLARVYKDIILRYKTMRGFYVPRKAGWDTHGLPVEMATEKALGLKSKKEIEKFGVGNFNKKAKELVWLYKKEWEEMTERIGYWLDLKNAYVTYENSYIETLWWILKRLWEEKLLYKGNKVVPWCTRCGTALSSHELAQGYKEVSDTSLYVKFKVKPNQKIGKFKTSDETYILSWTTTPWTLPGNVALAVGEKFDYLVVKTQQNEIFILEKNIFEKAQWPKHPLYGSLFVYKKQHVTHGPVLEVMPLKIKGEDLVGLEYEPLFKIPSLQSKNSYKIYPADFVTTDEGTGVVHTAVMYGEDDYALGKKVGLPEHHTVNEQGKFTTEVPGLAGIYVKAKEAEEKIIKYLQTTNYLLQTQKIEHEYPFCWRCDTPVIYYARNSWFIKMSKLRKELLAGNEKINWVPEHIKKGRFGEWLREAKDWNLSRERYWGTPLPIWECKNCNHTEVIGGFEELSATQGKPKNRYLFMRHGEAVCNLKKVINSDPKFKDKYPLTLRGRKAAEKTVAELKKEKIDLIIASDFRRARETAGIVAQGLEIKKVLYDRHFREIFTGVRDGKPSREYSDFFKSRKEKFEKAHPGGETLRVLGKRVFDGILDLEKKYDGKVILIVSHEYPIWMTETTMRGWSEEQSLEEKEVRGGDFIKPAEWRETPMLNLPRNEFNFADPHRPFVDEIVFRCTKCGGKMKRVKEVADVWFDSGAMPFASERFPFAQIAKSPPALLRNAKRAGKAQSENNLRLALRASPYPADYIAEAMDQTRGWFYTLLAVATTLGYEPPYKNVICLGLINDKNGQKMSKSKGNIVEPFAIINKYGIDAVRWYFYTVNPPGEPKNFDEQEILKKFRQFHMILYNSFRFYETYAAKNQRVTKNFKPNNVLDRWVLAWLNQFQHKIESKLKNYNVREAATYIERFVDDLSRWYIRRSRRRFQRPDSEKDFNEASAVLGYALEETAKLLAPFCPFFADALYKSIAERTNKMESVHLADWTKNKQITSLDKQLMEQMIMLRQYAAAGLAKRASIGVKVRQPLSVAKVNYQFSDEFTEILEDEINVKQIIFDKNLKEVIELDTNITHELREEGWLRELIRIIQDMRQDGGFEPKDSISLHIEFPEELNHIVLKNEKLLKKEINAKIIDYKRVNKFKIELETKLENWPIWLAIDKNK